MAFLASTSVGIPGAAASPPASRMVRLRMCPAVQLPEFAGLNSCKLKSCLRSRGRRLRSPGSLPSPVAERWNGEGETVEEESMSTDLLHRFIDLVVGKWNGLFYQFDAEGSILQNVETRLAASSYGEKELISLIQTLYIKQPPSRTFVSDYEDEPEWLEYKIKETNMFTVDKYQQIGFFQKENAFSLRYQTAGMLETVLRAGVLGEDDTGEDCPRNLKLPSSRPSVVCENCLYSMENDIRARAFHIMDPKGSLEMLIVFLEERGDNASLSSLGECMQNSTNRLEPFLGRWEGHSATKRTGVYGATIAVADTIALLEMDDKGQLIQDITTSREGNPSTNVPWTGCPFLTNISMAELPD